MRLRLLSNAFSMLCGENKIPPFTHLKICTLPPVPLVHVHQLLVVQLEDINRQIKMFAIIARLDSMQKVQYPRRVPYTQSVDLV